MAAPGEVRSSCARCAVLERRIAELGARTARDQEERTTFRRRLREHEQLLLEATRASKRQAAPFSRNQPKDKPKKPGRPKGHDAALRSPPPQIRAYPKTQCDTGFQPVRTRFWDRYQGGTGPHPIRHPQRVLPTLLQTSAFATRRPDVERHGRGGNSDRRERSGPGGGHETPPRLVLPQDHRVVRQSLRTVGLHGHAGSGRTATGPLRHGSVSNADYHN